MVMAGEAPEVVDQLYVATAHVGKPDGQIGTAWSRVVWMRRAWGHTAGRKAYRAGGQPDARQHLQYTIAQALGVVQKVRRGTVSRRPSHNPDWSTTSVWRECVPGRSEPYWDEAGRRDTRRRASGTLAVLR